MMSETRLTFGVATPIASSARHSVGQVALAHVRQHQVLLVADPDLAEAVAVGEIGDRIHLVGGGVARRSALRLERQRHDRVARHLVAGDRVVEPHREGAIASGASRSSSSGLSARRS